jgi:hypothetical protein
MSPEVEKRFLERAAEIRRTAPDDADWERLAPPKFKTALDAEAWSWAAARVRDFVTCHGVFALVAKGGHGSGVPIPFRLAKETATKVNARSGGPALQPWSSLLEAAAQHLCGGLCVELLCDFSDQRSKVTGGSLLLPVLLAWRALEPDYGEIRPLEILCTGTVEGGVVKPVEGIAAKRELARRMGVKRFIAPGPLDGADPLECALPSGIRVEAALRAIRDDLDAEGLIGLSFEQTCRRLDDLRATLRRGPAVSLSKAQRRLGQYVRRLVATALSAVKHVLLDAAVSILWVWMRLHGGKIAAAFATLTAVAMIGWVWSSHPDEAQPGWQRVRQLDAQIPSKRQSCSIQLRYGHETLPLGLTRPDAFGFTLDARGSDSRLNQPFTAEEFQQAVGKCGLALATRLMVRVIALEDPPLPGPVQMKVTAPAPKRWEIGPVQWVKWLWTKPPPPPPLVIPPEPLVRLPVFELRNAPYSRRELDEMTRFLSAVDLAGVCFNGQLIHRQPALAAPFGLRPPYATLKLFSENLERLGRRAADYNSVGGEEFLQLTYEFMRPQSPLGYTIRYRTPAEMLVAVVMEGRLYEALGQDAVDGHRVRAALPHLPHQPLLDLRHRRSDDQEVIEAIEFILQRHLPGETPQLTGAARPAGRA